MWRWTRWRDLGWELHGKELIISVVRDLTLLGDLGAVSRVDKMFVAKVYCADSTYCLFDVPFVVAVVAS